MFRDSGYLAVALFVAWSVSGPAIATGAKGQPSHNAVKAPVSRTLSRPQAQVAREIISQFGRPLSGQVRYQKLRRQGMTKQVWKDGRGNLRMLHKRPDGSQLIFVKQGSYRGWYGTNVKGSLALGERTREMGWSIKPQTKAQRSAPSSKPPAKVTVGIVGPGAVGTNAALQVATQLKQAGVNDVKVVLVGRTKASAAGRALDVSQAISAAGLQGVTIRGTASYRSLRGADVAVITAGAPRKPGMSRSDLVGVNAGVIRSIAGKLKANLPSRAPVVVVTNPLDAMTHLAAKILDPKPRAQRRVIGMAGALDSARLERSVQDMVARKFRVDASRVGKVSAVVVGTHGDEMVPLLSRLRVDGVPASRLLTSAELAKAVDATKKMGGTITKLVGQSAAVAPGTCVARMVTSIVKNSGDKVPSSVALRGEYGLKNVSLGVPVKLGRTGAMVVKTGLSLSERRALKTAAAKVRRDIQSIPR